MGSYFVYILSSPFINFLDFIRISYMDNVRYSMASPPPLNTLWPPPLNLLGVGWRSSWYLFLHGYLFFFHFFALICDISFVHAYAALFFNQMPGAQFFHCLWIDHREGVEICGYCFRGSSPSNSCWLACEGFYIHAGCWKSLGASARSFLFFSVIPPDDKYYVYIYFIYIY